MIKGSTQYAVTDNHVIIEKGSKKAMLRKRADLAKTAYETDKGIGNFDGRYHIYLAPSGIIGDSLS